MNSPAPILGDIERAELEAGLDPLTLRHTDTVPLIGTHTLPVF